MDRRFVEVVPMGFPVPEFRRKWFLKGLRWRIKIRYFAPHRLPSVRAFLHWQYAGWFIAAFVPFGVAMAIDHRYGLAYSAFVIAGLWSLGFWISSNFLEEKRKHIEKKEVRKDPSRLKREVQHLLIWEFVGLLAITVSVIACCYWTSGIKEDARQAFLKQQRDDVYDHISVQPTTFSGFGILDFLNVSVINGGHSNLEKHTLQCVTYSITNAISAKFLAGTAPSAVEVSLGLLGGGRGEIIKCDAHVRLRMPITCADMAFILIFTVEGQSDKPMLKKYRFSYGDSGATASSWIQQDVDLPPGPCLGPGETIAQP